MTLHVGQSSSQRARHAARLEGCRLAVHVPAVVYLPRKIVAEQRGTERPGYLVSLAFICSQAAQPGLPPNFGDGLQPPEGGDWPERNAMQRRRSGSAPDRRCLSADPGDYYSLYGVFASSVEPRDRDKSPHRDAETREHRLRGIPRQALRAGRSRPRHARTEHRRGVRRLQAPRRRVSARDDLGRRRAGWLSAQNGASVSVLPN